ncbi:hypothetical protein JB92DRAFT_693057 [Gautieria morchelliformis]|nr:hypothetical protein JB92DRAFT_693057 [Gautieria morchelliformis]
MTAPLFYGDYREQESEWLEKFLSDCRDHKWEVKKQIEYLRLSLVYSSPAGQWFTRNYEDSDATWPEIERTFCARWPQTATHEPIPAIEDEAKREIVRGHPVFHFQFRHHTQFRLRFRFRFHLRIRFRERFRFWENFHQFRLPCQFHSDFRLPPRNSVGNQATCIIGGIKGRSRVRGMQG